MYAEDVDLCWRAAQAGWATRYVPGRASATTSRRRRPPPGATTARPTAGTCDLRVDAAASRRHAHARGRCDERRRPHGRAALAARRGNSEEAAMHRLWVRRYALGLRARRVRSQALSSTRASQFTTISGEPVEQIYTPPTLRDPAEIGDAGEFPFTRGVYAIDVPRAAVDDAPVVRVGHRRGVQRALSLPAGERPDRAVGGLRHADADGLRLRPSCARTARSGAAAPRSTASPTWSGCSPASRSTRSRRNLVNTGPAAVILAFYVVAAERQGIAAEQLGGHDPDRCPQGVHRPEGVVLPDRPGDARADRHGRVLHAADAALAPRLGVGLPHPRGRGDRPAGAGVHAEERLHLRRGGHPARPRRRRRSRRGCRSSSTPTSTSSRRSPSTAPPAGSGRARCATPTARSDRALAADALPHADRRRLADGPAAAEQHRPHGDRGARRPCSAARSRCTPTPTTRRCRCRPRRPCGVAVRTQQIIAHESGVTNTVDPLGGSYFVEALTDRMEAAAYEYFAQDRRARRHGRGDQA